MELDLIPEVLLNLQHWDPFKTKAFAPCSSQTLRAVSSAEITATTTKSENNLLPTSRAAVSLAQPVSAEGSSGTALPIPTLCTGWDFCFFIKKKKKKSPLEKVALSESPFSVGRRWFHPYMGKNSHHFERVIENQSCPSPGKGAGEPGCRRGCGMGGGCDAPGELQLFGTVLRVIAITPFVRSA